jgi:hypothetical protein
MTWVIVIWSVLMAIWILAAIIGADNGDKCAQEAHQYLSQSTCTDARDVGTGIGVIVLWFIWFFGFLVLSLIWFMSRPKGRVCPACGENVRKGLTACPNCQYDFAKAVSHEPPPAATS